MPDGEYEALVREYFKDRHIASLRATIMNASGNFSRVFQISDFTGEQVTAPAGSAGALRDALKLVGKNKTPNGTK